MNKISSQKEESELYILYSQPSSKRMRHLIRFLLKISGIKLTINEPNHPETCILQTRNSISLRSRFTQLLIALYVAYVIIKSVLIIVFQYWHDMLLIELKPSVVGNSNASRLEGCATRANIYYSQRDGEKLEKIAMLNKWLKPLGNPWSLLNGTSSIGIGIGICVPIFISICGYIYMGEHLVQLNALNFIFNPTGELDRLRREVAKVIDSLIEKLIIYGLIIDKRNSYSMAFHKTMKGQINKFCTIYGEQLCLNQLIGCHKINSNYTLHYHQALLVDIKALDLVKPANVSYSWYKSLISLHYHYVISAWLGSILISLCSFYCATLYVLLARATNRLKQFECTRWHPDAVPMEDLLDPLESANDRQAYLLHDGSIQNLLWLAIFVEFESYATLPVIITWLEFKFIFCIFDVCWVACYSYLYFYSELCKRIWLNQIETQVSKCIRSMHYERLGRKDELIRDLTVAYLNLELYRRQQKSQLAFDNFLLNQTAIFLLATFLLCQLGRFISNTYSPFIMVESLYLAVLMNIYLVSGAVNTNKLEKLERRLEGLLVASHTSTIHAPYPIQLFKRLMNNNLLRPVMPTLFGAEITYTKLLSYNAYFAALLLLLYTK